ncbi:Protein FIZZY-RELATED 2 [Galdieria sulphuraria]|nr:Protein FIZZY-RELATED 2 [Galdieria sulphuraria]
MEIEPQNTCIDIMSRSVPTSPPPNVTRKRPNRYSDRFIPSREGGDLVSAFSLLESPKQSKPLPWLENCSDNHVSSCVLRISNGASPASTLSHSRSERDNIGDEEESMVNQEDRVETSYKHVLRQELFGEWWNETHCLEKSDSYNNLSGVDSSCQDYSNGFNSTFGEVRQWKDWKQLNNSSKKLFRFKARSKSRLVTSPLNLSLEGLLSSEVFTSTPTTTRKIVKSPYKVLDAPNLADDFYLNLVDWSCNNILAVGLDRSVYLWNALNSKVTKLCEVSSGDAICSVSWSPRGKELAVGTRCGEVHLYDVSCLKNIRTFMGHTLRVGCLSWNDRLLASGSRDHSIRVRDWKSPSNQVIELCGHSQEVCGLKWSYDDKYLASGGNDNKLFIWNPGCSFSPVNRLDQHTAAVKAIAWSPHQSGLLCSGGGTADRCIRFWNVVSGTLLKTIDTGSQVCNIAWSKNVNEFVSTHGYSQNQIIVWKYPSLSKVTTLTGHTYRVLYLAVSPDNESIVTGAGDETLRFWNVFPGTKTKADTMESKSMLSSCRTCLR